MGTLALLPDGEEASPFLQLCLPGPKLLSNPGLMSPPPSALCWSSCPLFCIVASSFQGFPRASPVQALSLGTASTAGP